MRGAVVICPPLAYEAVCAHESLRLLGEQLASRGIVAMRIDYDGTSNSIGSGRDPERVTAWRQTIVDAVTELRAWGVGPVHLVGLRVGATLAAGVAADTTADAPAVDGVVMWDPVVSGRRYSRELQMLSASSGLRPEPADDGIAIAGVRLSADTLADLKRVNLETVDVPCLVINRSERSESPDTPAEQFGSDVEQRSLDGTEAMLGTDVELAVAPLGILTAVVDWIDGRLPTATTPVEAPSLTGEALESNGGTALVHRAGRIGAGELFRIETTEQGRRPECAVVMLNNGLAPLIGPGRSWFELAAEVAARGWAAVRVDFSGIGDSPARPGCETGEPYPPHGGSDIADVVAALRAEGVRQIALIGLCSGAVLAFDGAIATDGIDVIISVNGRFDRPFFDERRYRRLRAAPHTNRLIAIPFRKTPLLAWFAKVPTFVWRLLDRTRIVPDPTHAIRRIVTDRRRVMMIFGEHEWGLIALRRRGGKRFNALVDDPLVTLSICPGLDHSMFDLAARAEVLDRVTNYLGEIWSTTSPVAS